MGRTKFMSMSVVDLKKELAKNGLGELNKKDEIVNALLVAHEQKDKILARKADLKALGQDQLKSILVSKGLPPCRSVALMIEAVSYAEKVAEVAAKMKVELDE